MPEHDVVTWRDDIVSFANLNAGSVVYCLVIYLAYTCHVPIHAIHRFIFRSCLIKLRLEISALNWQRQCLDIAYLTVGCLNTCPRVFCCIFAQLHLKTSGDSVSQNVVAGRPRHVIGTPRLSWPASFCLQRSSTYVPDWRGRLCA